MPPTVGPDHYTYLLSSPVRVSVLIRVYKYRWGRVLEEQNRRQLLQLLIMLQATLVNSRSICSKSSGARRVHIGVSRLPGPSRKLLFWLRPGAPWGWGIVLLASVWEWGSVYLCKVSSTLPCTRNLSAQQGTFILGAWIFGNMHPCVCPLLYLSKRQRT